MKISAEEDARFKVAVQNSRREVLVVERHLRAKGYLTELAPQRIRDDFAERAAYGDDADLFILTDKGRIGVEVKGRTLAFTSADDFPYPTLFVDRVSKVEKSTVQFYVSLNKSHTYMAVILASTKASWVKRDTFDHVKKHELTVYECPKELIRFYRVETESVAKGLAS